jgi:fructose 1,6-bisphosphatase
MRLTISAIGAEIGSIAGLAPSVRLLAAIHATLHPAKYRREESEPLIVDYHVSYVGYGVTILMTHSRGLNDSSIYQLAWAAIREAAKVAVVQGLCQAGKCFERKHPGFAELEFEERPGEAFLLFSTEHIDPKAFILPLDRASAADQVVAAAGSVMLIRTGLDLLDTRKVLAAFAAGDTVVMPVPLNTPVAYSEALPIVSCAAFSVHKGRLTEPVDCFANPYWNAVRDKAAQADRAHSAEFLVARTVEFVGK